MKHMKMRQMTQININQKSLQIQVVDSQSRVDRMYLPCSIKAYYG